VNGDGALDVVLNGGFDITVLRGRGDGSLRAALRWPASTFGAQTRIVDVTGDGRADVVALSTSSSAGAPFRLDVLVAGSDGTWTAAAPKYIGGSPGTLAVADLDGDKKMDIVLSRTSPSELDLLVGDGKGGFGDPQKQRAVAGGVSTADFDADGK